jgi:DNA-binding NarL/FixJ family response regulator
MNYVWKRISKEDVERLVKKHNLEPLEQRIIEMRSEGKPLYYIAREVCYSVRSVERHSNKILNKILDDI